MLPRARRKLPKERSQHRSTVMPGTNLSVASMGIDIGKNSFHVVGPDRHGAIVVGQ